jgi:threonine dehydrogenase-like Zn-dependent dehydrogenase
MRAVVYANGNASFVTDYPVPEPSENTSLVRVELAAICNTDREILRGYRPDFAGIMGHEFVGIVEQSRSPTLLNQRVVGEINLNCGDCLYCNSNRPHHCEKRLTLGINNHDGAFADYLVLPNALLWPVGDQLDAEHAVFTEPLAAAAHITEQLPFTPALPVAIVGDGRLALLICQALAALTEAQLTVIGKHVDKLALFEPYARVSLEPTGNYEVVIDATGNPESLASSIALTRSGGTLVMKSTYADTAVIDMSEIVVREITIIGSRCGEFPPALELLRSGRINLPPLELFTPENYTAAFNSQAFKAALDFRS